MVSIGTRPCTSARKIQILWKTPFISKLEDGGNENVLCFSSYGLNWQQCVTLCRHGKIDQKWGTKIRDLVFQ